MQNTTRNILDDVIKNNQINVETAQNVIANIRTIVKEYVAKNKLKSLVLGVSGGLDSACIAALCQEKYTGVPLIGISIPLKSTNDHMEKAEWVGTNYCTAFEEFNAWEEDYLTRETIENNIYNTIPFYEKMFNVLEKTDGIAIKAGFQVNTFPKNILNGNMKARIRMITLYDLARKTNGMVLSTDNYSELLMGFWTINGDVGDYGPIQNIFKGIELPTIARALGIREDIITQKPSDGLMVTEDNTDEAQLGAEYKYVDAIMIVYLDKDKTIYNQIKDDETVQKIVNRYEAMTFKRIGTINLTRDEIGINL